MLLQPRIRRNACGLGSSRFDRHYSGNRLFLSSPAGTKMFQFPAFAPHCCGLQSSTAGVPPFGHLRINSCLQIPGAFRSLPRPSSLSEAKASSVRSCSLSLCESLATFRLKYYSFCLEIVALQLEKTRIILQTIISFYLVISLSIVNELWHTSQQCALYNKKDCFKSTRHQP